jgi:hypothetical protein
LNSCSCLTSPSVNLLTKTGCPFQTICNTSPGGNSEISTYIYVFLSYLFHPFNLPIIPIAYNLANENTAP